MRALYPTSAISRPIAALVPALLLLAAAAGATVYLPISDSELADSATVIVEGRILAVEPADDERPAIDYQVEVETLLKGTVADDLIVVRVPGGVRSDGIGFLLLGAPRFRTGEEVLLFLKAGEDDTFVLHQLMLGAFRIENENGQRVARRDLSGATRIAHLGVGAPEGLRDAENFHRWLNKRMIGEVSEPSYFLPATPRDPEGTVHEAFRTIVSTSDPPPFGCGEDGGHSVRWFEFTADSGPFDIGWRTHFKGQEGVPDGGFQAFQRALAAWNSDPHTPIAYTFDGLTASTGGLSTLDGVNAILFNDPNREIPGSFDGEGLLALGGPWFDCDTLNYQGEKYHPILAADIVTQDGLELFFASTPDPASAAEQLFAHELGHTLGFAHTEDSEALMYGLFHPDQRGATLDVDDLAGVLHLYGQRELPIPTAPTELTATAPSGGRVLLEWNDTANDESVFQIERRQLGDFERIGSAPAGATSWVDTSVEPTTQYGYRLRAVNGAGASTYTDVAEVVTGEDPRPDAPSALRAAPLSSTEVRLTWQDNSDDESGFVVDLLIPPDWVEIPVQLSSDTNKVIVEGLPSASRLNFRVRAINAYGTSAPSNSASTSTFNHDDCVVTGDELCLLGGRFKVSVDYRNQHAGGTEGSATVVPSTDETGLFWFFGPQNVELIVKVLDGRSINEHFWLFYGALTDLEYTVTLTDTATSEAETYHNPPGEICGRADTVAIPEAPQIPAPPLTLPWKHTGSRLEPLLTPAPISTRLQASNLGLRPTLETPDGASPLLKSGSCEPGPQNLCLLDDRLSVEVWWRNPHGGRATEGPGQAIADSDSTGMFWFFNIENTELVVKALNGDGLNDHLWFFYGALTDLEYWISVTDTLSGDRRVYYNPPGEVCGRADTQAFRANPSSDEPPDDPPGEPPEDPEIPR